jgi:hypothetical protein
MNRLSTVVKRVCYQNKYAFFRAMKGKDIILRDGFEEESEDHIEEFLQSFRKKDEKALESEKLNEMIRELYIDKGVSLIVKVLGRSITRNQHYLMRNLKE